MFSRWARLLDFSRVFLVFFSYFSHVSFAMCLNNKGDVNKLQILQNRALRMCYNIQNPRDISVSQLHTMAKVDMLEKRRLTQLLGILYDVAPTSQQDRVILHNTRTATKYNVELSIANTQLYTRSPYYVGGQIWNNLPRLTQELKPKEQFKRAISNII